MDTNPITIDVDNKLYNTINFLATNVGMDTNEKTAIVSIYYVGDPIPVVATNINHIKSFRLYNTPTPPVYQTGEAFVGQLQARNVSGGWYPGSLYKYTISPDSTRVVDKIMVDCANAAVFAATTVGLSANENSFEYLTNGMNFDSLDLLPGTTISSTSIIRLADYGSNPNIYVGIYNQANKLCYLRVATLDNLSVGALTTISFSPITLEATQGSSFSAKTFILNDNLVPLATSFTHGNAKPGIFLAGDSTCRQSLVSELPYKGWGTDFGTFFNSKVTVSNRAKGGYTTKMFINEGYLTSIINSGKPGDFLFVQFGTNDSNSSPSLNVPLADYETNLRNFISSARNKGMTPVLLTSVYMYSEVYLNGNVNNNSSSISPYRQKCIDLGAELNVPVLDVGAAHKALALSWGVDNAKKLFNWNTTANTFDGVHMSGIGADEIAKIVVKKIKENSSNAMISLEGLINNAVSIDAVLSSIVYPW